MRGACICEWALSCPGLLPADYTISMFHSSKWPLCWILLLIVKKLCFLSFCVHLPVSVTWSWHHRDNLCWHLVTAPDTWPRSSSPSSAWHRPWLPRAPRATGTHFRLWRVRVDFRWSGGQLWALGWFPGPWPWGQVWGPGALGKLWSQPETISAWSALNKLTSLPSSGPSSSWISKTQKEN